MKNSNYCSFGSILCSLVLFLSSSSFASLAPIARCEAMPNADSQSVVELYYKNGEINLVFYTGSELINEEEGAYTNDENLITFKSNSYVLTIDGTAGNLVQPDGYEAMQCMIFLGPLQMSQE